MDRKSRADLSQAGGMSAGRERLEGGKNAQDFKNINITDMSPAKYAASLFWRLQDFHKLLKDVGLQKQEHGMTEHCLLERSIFI